MTDLWTEITLGDVIELYDHKRIPLNTQQRSERQGKYPYYGAAGIIDSVDDYIFDGKYLLIAEDGSVITQDGKPVLNLVNGKFWVSNHAHVVKGKPPISTDFLYFALSNVVILGYLTGTAQPKLSQTNLKTIRLSLPPLSVQQKITSILGVYDDLIENNTRRIKILEDMAQTLYREWFVHFRFPGHENVPMVESPLGPIPQGWEVKRLDEVAQLHRGRSYRSVNLVEDGEGFPFLNLKNIKRDGGFRPDGLKWYDGQFKETQVAFSNDIIMALTDVTQDRKVVARSARIPDLGYEKYVFSMDLLKVESSELMQMDFLYALLKYSSFPEKLKEYANGTTVLHLSPNHVQSSELVLPPNILRQRYAEVAMSIRQQSDLLEKKNVSLRQTRDLLLPKLISGEIDVSELDIDIDGMQPTKGGTYIPYPLTERLHSDEKILGGKPVIKGTRLAVAFILDLLKQGWSEEDIVENYPSVVHEDIEACRAYQEKVKRASVSR